MMHTQVKRWANGPEECSHACWEAWRAVNAIMPGRATLTPARRFLTCAAHPWPTTQTVAPAACATGVRVIVMRGSLGAWGPRAAARPLGRRALPLLVQLALGVLVDGRRSWFAYATGTSATPLRVVMQGIRRAAGKADTVGQAAWRRWLVDKCGGQAG